MQTARLYDLTDDAVRLANAIATVEEYALSADPELQTGYAEAKATLEAELALVADQIAEKSDSYAWVVKDFEAKQAAYKARADEFAAKAKVAENGAKRIKAALLDALGQLGVDKVKGADYTVARQRNGQPAVTVLPEAEPRLVHRGLGRMVVTVTTEPCGLLEPAETEANAERLDNLVEAIQDAVNDAGLVATRYEPDRKAILDAVKCYGNSAVTGLAEVTTGHHVRIR